MCHLKTKEFVFYQICIRFCCHLLWGILVRAIKLIYTLCTHVWANMYLPTQGRLCIMFFCRQKSPGSNEYSEWKLDFMLFLYWLFLFLPTILCLNRSSKLRSFISFKEWFQSCCQILLHLSHYGKLNMALETKVISIWFQLKPTWNILVFTSRILQWPLLSLINASLEELLLLSTIGEP